MNTPKNKLSHAILEQLIRISGYIIIIVVAVILGNIFYRGIFYNNQLIFDFKDFLALGEDGMLTALLNTLKMTGVSVLIGFPIGLGTAIFLVEYKIKQRNIKTVIDFSITTLGGIPSIIYGVFGLAVFGIYFKLGLSFMTGALTMALMMIPITITSVREELIAVPNTYREASFGLGATKTQTIFRVVLPSAIRGIVNSFLLSISRILGESAALLVTVNAASKTLSLYIYGIRGNEELSLERFYALIGQSAMMLTLLIITIVFITQRIEKKRSK